MGIVQGNQKCLADAPPPCNIRGLSKRKFWQRLVYLRARSGNRKNRPACRHFRKKMRDAEQSPLGFHIYLPSPAGSAEIPVVFMPPETLSTSTGRLKRKVVPCSERRRALTFSRGSLMRMLALIWRLPTAPTDCEGSSDGKDAARAVKQIGNLRTRRLSWEIIMAKGKLTGCVDL